jgi:hypothetical protein
MKITRSQEQWRTILNEQQTSGQTIIDYCREHQLATSSFMCFVKNQVSHQVVLFVPKSPNKLS